MQFPYNWKKISTIAQVNFPSLFTVMWVSHETDFNYQITLSWLQKYVLHVSLTFPLDGWSTRQTDYWMNTLDSREVKPVILLLISILHYFLLGFPHNASIWGHPWILQLKYPLDYVNTSTGKQWLPGIYWSINITCQLLIVITISVRNWH